MSITVVPYDWIVWYGPPLTRDDRGWKVRHYGYVTHEPIEVKTGHYTPAQRRVSVLAYRKHHMGIWEYEIAAKASAREGLEHAIDQLADHPEEALITLRREILVEAKFDMRRATTIAREFGHNWYFE